jgi:hypothetical protein
MHRIGEDEDVPKEIDAAVAEEVQDGLPMRTPLTRTSSCGLFAWAAVIDLDTSAPRPRGRRTSSEAGVPWVTSEFASSWRYRM